MRESMVPVKRRTNPQARPARARPRFKEFPYGRGPDLLWDREYNYEDFRQMQLSELAYEDLNLKIMAKRLKTNFKIKDDYRKFDPVGDKLRHLFQHPFIGRKLVSQRQSILEELLTNEPLLECLSQGLELLSDGEMEKMKADASARDASGYNVAKLELHQLLNATKMQIKGYQKLQEALGLATSPKLQQGFRYISTIVGDPRFREAEELLTRMDNGSYTFKLDYIPGEHPKVTIYKKTLATEDSAQLTLPNGFSSTLADSFSKVIVTFANSIFSYVQDEKFKYSLDAYRALATFFKDLEREGFNFCKPEIVPKSGRKMMVEEAVNPLLLKSDKIVANDINHNPQKNMFVLTGSNNGGKTTYIKTVGLIQVWAEAGLYVPAKRAVISPVDNIYTHFVTPDDITQGEGRYRNELRRLRTIFEKATPFSLVLADEPCGGTSVNEGGEQSLYLLDGFHRLGCPTYFTTHIHKVAEEVDLSGRYPAAKNLQVEVRQNEGGTLQFTYKIVAGRAGKSYAAEVAKKYEMGPSHIQQILESRVKMGQLKKEHMR